MSDVQTFHVGDILSITTGRLVSPDHIGGVYRILNHLTADNLMTHQLPRAMDECEPYLRECFPDLAAIPEPDLHGEDDVRAWLRWIVSEYGETREVEAMPDGVHEYRNPIAEAEEVVGKDRVIVVRPEDR
jgi:hypothetical protein